MSLSLTKIEIQEILREMGVKISHKSTYEELVEIYKKENHRRWLGISDNPRIRPKAERVKGFVRRRPAMISSKIEPMPSAPLPDPETHNNHQSVKANKSMAPEPPPKSLNDNPPVSDVSTDVNPVTPPMPVIINESVRDMAMKRAKGFCELCEKPVANEGNNVEDSLQLFYFSSDSDSVNKNIKSVALLCPDCFKRMDRKIEKKDISKLKKMARRRISAPLVVMERTASGSLEVRER